MRRKVKGILSLTNVLTFSSITLTSIGVLASCSSTSETRVLVLESNPIKTRYEIGETLDLTGLSVVAKKVVDSYLSNEDVEIISTYDVSLADGTVLNESGEIEITVSKKGYVSTSFKISVGEDYYEYKLRVISSPTKVSYNLGETFSSTGLKVRGITYKNGDYTTAVESEAIDTFETNPKNGEVLNESGSIEVSVSADGYEDATFTISVLNYSTKLTNMIQKIQNSTNYTVEIYNTVATTLNSYGFHYKDYYTDDYFDRITYKKSEAEETTANRGKKIDSQNAYVNYSGGVYQVSVSDGGEIEPSKPMSDKTSWWDANLVTTFRSFALSDVPTDYDEDNDLFRYVVDVDKDELVDDDTDFTNTIKNNPFATTFLNVCGWSTSLFSILTRIDITVDEVNDKLSMKGMLGSYGYTTIDVYDFDFTSSYELDEYMKEDDRSYDTSLDENISNGKLEAAFNSQNYKLDMISLTTTGDLGVVNFTSDGVFLEYTGTFKSYANELGYYNIGYLKLNGTNSSGTTYNGDVYLYQTDKTGVIKDSDFMSIAYAFGDSQGSCLYGDVAQNGYFKSLNYNIEVKYGYLSYIIDVLTGENEGFTWYTYSSFSTDSEPFIVSRAASVRKSLVKYFNAYYSNWLEEKLTVDDFTMSALQPTYSDSGELQNLEIWLLTNEYSGYRLTFYDFGDTETPEYVKDYLSTLTD